MSCGTQAIVTACPPCVGQSCPKPAGVANSLGFANVPSCCKFACPKFPFHRVQLCIKINRQTAVKIEQGCLVGEPSGTTCPVKYASVLTQDSWGRECRIVSWDRQVPTDTFIRITLCPADDCTVGCGVAADALAGVCTNALLKVLIDGVDYLSFIQNTVRGSETPGIWNCWRAWCAIQGAVLPPGTPVTDCCATTGTINWETVDALPWGAQFVLGPIGAVVA